MSVVPGEIDTDQQPPMTIPLRHFVVAAGFLVAGALLGVGMATDLAPGVATLAHVHLLLAGWVCITIMGAMTQFVPVWSNAALHSRRLATAQLWLVVAGLLGFAASFLADALALLPVFGAVMLVGFWTFVYNVGRTLWSVDSYDVTERHFALALGFFLLVTTFGFLLALDFTHPVLAGLGISHQRLLAAHATLAVFGAVLTTVFGALYQLGTMFTQTELHGIDHHLRRVEEVGYPLGVLALAGGRLVGNTALARDGGLLIVVAVVGIAAILARKLIETRVEWTPMLSRYAVAAPALGLWAVLTAPAWLADPLAPAALFGAPGASHLLLLGGVGFVVLGTLYHVVPFIVWVHRYSDRLGFEDVPMIDDLYDGQLATVDFALLTAGTALLVVGDLLSLPVSVTALGGVLVTFGAAAFAANLLLVLRDHSPQSIPAIMVSRLAERERADGSEEKAA
ncbi:MAG: hypothetical protein ABEJ31_11210 [Haloarculaceae archaeon]